MPTTTYYTNRPGSLGGPISISRNGQSHFPLYDMQGHARQITDINGNVTDTMTTDAFGVVKASTGNTPIPYKAFGEYGYFTDTPSRLYVRARHLRVDEGRWVSRDPIGFGGGDWNLYGYCSNMPLLLVDCNGKSVWQCIVKGPPLFIQHEFISTNHCGAVGFYGPCGTGSCQRDEIHLTPIPGYYVGNPPEQVYKPGNGADNVGCELISNDPAVDRAVKSAIMV